MSPRDQVAEDDLVGPSRRRHHESLQPLALFDRKGPDRRFSDIGMALQHFSHLPGKDVDAADLNGGVQSAGQAESSWETITVRSGSVPALPDRTWLTAEPSWESSQ
jgi:hypothetical protein